MLTGTDLIADINACQPGRGRMALWWLGQHSYVVKIANTVLYIDVFFTAMPDRLVPPLIPAELATNADFICGTHDHADHIDHPAWPIAAQASPQAKFVVPQALVQGLAEEFHLPVQRFLGVDDGLSVQAGPVKITGVPAAHEFLAVDPKTGGNLFLGFVFEADGLCFYHAGDTCMYEGMQAKLRRWHFDLMLLPINGRDAKRLSSGCIGNLTFQEAADLAGALQPKLVLPAHYDMFAMNSANPQDFLDYYRVKYPNLRAETCEYGQRMIWPR